MKHTFIHLIANGLLLTCSSSDMIKVSNETISVRPYKDSIETKTERNVLIEKLRRLQVVFASNDKEKIAEIFSFPISNETVGIYIDDKSFNDQLKKNGDKTTRSMFMDSYQDISESLQIDQINQLFKYLNIDRLLEQDTLEYEALIKTEPCYHFYGIKIEKGLVTLTVGTNSNKDYKSKSTSENEIPENDDSICEHVLWWIFKFDGKQLHLKEISGAG